MALDFNAMKAALASVQKKSNDNLWKPEEGDNKIRLVPLAGRPENPFQVLWFHYNLGGKTYLSPLSYGERDPLAEFSDQLIGEGNLPKETYKEYKKWHPQARTYVPIVVRGKEEEGVKFWAFGKKTYEQILVLINNEEYGDITDVETGTDLTVTFTPAEKSATKFAETTITASRKSSVLHKDPAVRDKLLTTQPVLLDQYKRHTYDELVDVLKRQLNVASTPETDASSAAEATTSESPTAQKAAETTKKLSAEASEEFDNIFNS